MLGAMIDAHNHLQDARLAPWLPQIMEELSAMGMRTVVVNGTREEDWTAVAALAARYAWVMPSYGLHPWYVAMRSADWMAVLEGFLDRHPGCGVGEIGLDRWIEGHDVAVQEECFRAQLGVATERGIPMTIHCLRAWGALWEILRETAVPARGFLLHAYGGPAEMVRGFVERGAYFSFSTSFLHERKAAQREVFRQIPEERILVETDAPDMAPPPGSHVLAGGEALNHPANIERAYAELARLRGWDGDRLKEVVRANFARWTGRCPGDG